MTDANLCTVCDPLKLHHAGIGKCFGPHLRLPWNMWTLVGNSRPGRQGGK